MRRVLVTGARGFLGMHCLAALAARGWVDIHATSRSEGVSPGVTWHACDLFDPAATVELLTRVKPSHLLHLAWCAVPGKYWTSPENLHWVAASAVLLEAFARAGGERFVGAGSCAEYEWGGGACSEAETPLVPRSPYGISKHAVQTLVSGFASLLGLSTAWGRVFFPYGPGEHPDRLVAHVTRALLAGRPALCTSGEQRRDYIFVADAADAFASLLGSEVAGAINIGTGHAIAVKDVVAAIGANIGRPDLITMGARSTEAGEPALLVADIGRLEGELHWTASTSIGAGIDRCVDYWRRVDVAGSHAALS